jgi:hypothetical protein
MCHPCSSEVAGAANRSGKLQWLDGCLFQGRYEIIGICTARQGTVTRTGLTKNLPLNLLTQVIMSPHQVGSSTAKLDEFSDFVEQAHFSLVTQEATLWSLPAALDGKDFPCRALKVSLLTKDH